MNFSLDQFKSRLIKSFDNDPFLGLKIESEINNCFDFAISKYMPGFHRGFERGTGHIKGTYSDNNDSKFITIKVRSNIVWAFLLLWLLGLILYNIYLLVFTRVDIGTIIFKILAFTFCIVLDYIMAKGFSDNIKDNFEDVINSNLAQ